MIRVLVATHATQGQRPDDYCWTVDGELVRLPGPICDDPRCGCAWGFAGLTSSRATTTAMVAERDMDRAAVRAAFLEALRREGWCPPDEAPSWMGAFVEVHLAAVADAQPGDVFEIGPGETIRPRPPGLGADQGR